MNFFRKKPPLNHRSQIAVIITFVIAVIILFTAVFINITKVSQVKTTTSTSADKAALSLASQLGSMSHYYKNTVLKINGPCTTVPCQVCGPGWLALIAVAVTTGAVSFFFPHAIVVGSTIAAAISATMVGGISDVFNKEMTLYNSLREQTLFQALLSTQTDDVELKSMGAGLFRDEPTGEDYNLSAIPGMLEEKKAGRFLAWYYNKRIPLLIGDEKELKNALDTFNSGLKRVIDIDADGWDSSKWKINKLSYVIEPGPASKGADYAITCASPNCPAWVRDSAKGQLRILDMDATLTDQDPKIDPQIIDGFLQDKLTSLLTRLQAKYNGTFCEDAGCKIKPSDLTSLIGDLAIFLARSREVLNMPVSAKFNNITQWSPLFYNPEKHNADRSAKNCDSLDCDIYLRLIRDQAYINNLIVSLESLNNDTIMPNIVSNHGTYCEQGRPDSAVAYSCFTAIASCYCWHTVCGEYSCWKVCDGNKCTTSLPARWYGNYGTCTGSGFNHTEHPVCKDGDLYGAPPNYFGSNWCNKLRSVPCVSNNDKCDKCSPPPTKTVMDNSYYFQGQMSWDNTSGPIEVEQALKILRALNYDIDNIKKTIEALADAIKTKLPDESPLRNEIVYAWKDKPVEGKAQFSHLVRVKIESYPAKLPYVNESVRWLGLEKCRQLENDSGDFTITTSRYDQDQPTDIGKTDEGGWQLSRRRQGPSPTGKEFSPVVLDHIVADIQHNGKILTSNEGYVKQLLYWYAITSCSKAHYGTEKSDIYITGTKCD